jgi:hypothetical protein
VKGFYIHPVAPAAFPACFLLSCDSVVNITIGNIFIFWHGARLFNKFYAIHVWHIEDQ